jgi:hypothetical protein
MKRLLALFEISGNGSQPYKAAGWEVVQVDIQSGTDILTWDYKRYPRDHFAGIIAFPPCTAYTKAGNRYWKKKDESGETEYSNRLVRRTLEIVDYFRPGISFWMLENPAGRIEKCVPVLKKYRLLSFHPFEFGDGYTKYTVLYGEFNPFLVRKYSLPKKEHRRQSGTDSLDAYFGLTGNYGERKNARSVTPLGFAKAFFNANSGQ